MSPVGVASIVLGMIVVCSRAPLLVAPGATLRWFGRLIETNARLRRFGVILAILGAGILWAGTTEHSTLATVMTILGAWVVAASSFLLIAFPAAYRQLATVFLPANEQDEASLLGWRLLGGLGTGIGLLLVYYGVLALPVG